MLFCKSLLTSVFFAIAITLQAVHAVALSMSKFVRPLSVLIFNVDELTEELTDVVCANGTTKRAACPPWP